MATSRNDNAERDYPAYDWDSYCERIAALHLPRFAEIPDIPLYMDQLIGFVGKQMELFALPTEKPLTSSMVNNYVKMRLVPQPESKRYQPLHVAYLIMVCLAKRMYSMNEIERLIALDVQHRFQVPDAYDRFIELFEGSLRAIFCGGSRADEVGRISTLDMPGALGLVVDDTSKLTDLDRSYLVFVNSIASKIYIEQMLLNVDHRLAQAAKGHSE
ncbi:MAG: DUF1836 domain-containing protein [Coriobacteriia bacterium]|nr:DUF1836 domain-containing protein [Coriobacteriia bacterium]